MTNMTANAAKTRFGELLDTAQREPVTIEKHGRPVAVVMSMAAYEEAEALKLERLRTEVRMGLEALDAGEFVEVDGSDLRTLAEEIKVKGREMRGT
jgi:prevent-host-death family protein